MMLVLSRKTGEKVIIGDNIEVTVLKVCGNQVRLGFNAPLEMVIRREELTLRIQDEPIDAARSESDDIAASRTALRRSCPRSPRIAHAV